MSPEQNWLLAVFCLNLSFALLVETASTGYCQSLLNNPPLCRYFCVFVSLFNKQICSHQQDTGYSEIL